MRIGKAIQVGGSAGDSKGKLVNFKGKIRARKVE